MKINADDTIMEAVEKNAEAPRILMGFGMHCIGCAAARGETIAQAAEVHGIDIDEMLTKLNEGIE